MAFYFASNRTVIDHIVCPDSLIIIIDGVIVKDFPRMPVKRPSSILKLILERL